MAVIVTMITYGVWPPPTPPKAAGEPAAEKGEPEPKVAPPPNVGVPPNV